MASPEIVKIAMFLGAGISVSVSSVACGIGEGYIAGEAARAMMKQPGANDKLFRNMFVGQAIAETGGIFSLVISMLLLFSGLERGNLSWFTVASLLASGIAVGLGSVGPVLGSGYAGGQACVAIGRQPEHSNDIMGNMLIGQALAQTSSIFALVVSLLLIYSIPHVPEGASLGWIIMKSTALLGAGLVIGFGTLGPGSGIGNVAGRANDMIGRYPAQRKTIMRTMFIGAAVSESTAIYSLVVSLLLIFAIK